MGPLINSPILGQKIRANAEACLKSTDDFGFFKSLINEEIGQRLIAIKETNNQNASETGFTMDPLTGLTWKAMRTS